MRQMLIRSAAMAALVLLPAAAMAQGAADSSDASAKMKGPPNANGAGSTDKNEMTPSATGRSESSDGTMRGPPNADGAPGATGPGDAK